MEYIKGKELETFDDFRFAEKPVIFENKIGWSIEADLEWMSVDEFIGYKRSGYRFYERVKPDKGIWHKVSEDGLPKTNDYILVYLRSRSKSYHPTVSMAMYYPDEEHWWIAVNSPEILDDDDEIVAWMEIPKYEEE